MKVYVVIRYSEEIFEPTIHVFSSGRKASQYLKEDFYTVCEYMELWQDEYSKWHIGQGKMEYSFKEDDQDKFEIEKDYARIHFEGQPQSSYVWEMYEKEVEE